MIDRRINFHKGRRRAASLRPDFLALASCENGPAQLF